MDGKLLKQYRTGEIILFTTESTTCEVVRITDLFAIKHSGGESTLHC